MGAGCGATSGGIAVPPNLEPTEKWFNVDKENERGQSVALDGAPADRDCIGDDACPFADDNPCRGSVIDALDHCNQVCWVTKVLHDAEKFRMADSVESIREVDIHGKNIAMTVAGIFENGHEALQLACSIAAREEAFLMWAEHKIVGLEGGCDNRDKTSPELVNRSVEANRAFVNKVGMGVAFVEQSGVRHFPRHRGMACHPKQDKQEA